MVSSLLARCIIVTIGTLYPGYRSYKSLINSDLREAVNCLRYWIVFSIFIACETVTDVLLSWFPFYYWIKIGIVLWMNSPVGTALLYKRFIHPVLKEREQDIDQLLEQTKQKGYSTLLDLTNKGFRYASNMFLNTAVLGQAYLGEHLKRSLSTSDIDASPNKKFSNPPATLYEEEEEADQEFSKRLKEDRKYLSNGPTRRPQSQPRKKPLENPNDPLGDMEMANVIARKQQQQQRVATRITSSALENSNLGKNSKRQISTKKPIVKPAEPIDNQIDSSNDSDADEDLEN